MVPISWGGEILVERTLAIIKPDAIKKRVFGLIIQKLLDEGFEILNMKFLKIGREVAEKFYESHKGKDFFEGLMNFITSGPIIVLALERENAIEHLRKVIGNTNPKEAEEGTIRFKFGENVQRNAIHGSDCIESAKRELSFFFSEHELL